MHPPKSGKRRSIWRRLRIGTTLALAFKFGLRRIQTRIGIQPPSWFSGGQTLTYLEEEGAGEGILIGSYVVASYHSQGGEALNHTALHRLFYVRDLSS